MAVQINTRKRITSIKKIKKILENSVTKKDIDLYYETEDRKLIYKNLGYY